MLDESLSSSLQINSPVSSVNGGLLSIIMFCCSVGGPTKLIEGPALLPVGRESSCGIEQGKTFPWLAVLQVHKQLVVLWLSGKTKINNYSKSCQQDST